MGTNDKRFHFVFNVIVLNRLDDGRRMYSSSKIYVLSFMIRNRQIYGIHWINYALRLLVLCVHTRTPLHSLRLSKYVFVEVVANWFTGLCQSDSTNDAMLVEAYEVCGFRRSPNDRDLTWFRARRWLRIVSLEEFNCWHFQVKAENST